MPDQVMGPAPQRPGRSVLVACGVSRSPRTRAWEDVLCLIFDAPLFDGSALSRRRESVEDHALWRVGIPFKHRCTDALRDRSAGMLVRRRPCIRSCKPVLACDFTKTRSPRPRLFPACDVIQFPLAAEGRVSRRRRGKLIRKVHPWPSTLPNPILPP